MKKVKFITFLLCLTVMVVLLAFAGCAPEEPPVEPDLEVEEPEEPVADEAPEYRMTLAGASPGGLWSLLGEGVSSAVAEAYPGSSITYEVSSGVANIGMVARGEVEMGITHDVEAMAALEGIEAFEEEGPIEDIYALAYMYNWSAHQFHIIESFAEEYGIETMADIPRVQPSIAITVNQRGNMVEALNRAIFEEYGFTYEDVEEWGGQIIFAPSGEAADLQSDRRVQLNANNMFAPHSSFIEAGRAVDLKMLPIDEEVIEAVNEKWGTERYVVSAGTYDWLDEDYPTVGMGAMIIINQDVPQEAAYNLTKALVENVGAIQGVHAAMEELTPELMASQTVVPYHPGAEEYYREAGLLD